MNRQIDIGIVQINNSFSGHNYFPYSVGLLEAYARAHSPDPSRFHFRLPIYRRAPVAQIAGALAGCDIVGFSSYVWNIRLSLEVAKAIKAAKPETVIVFGGPQVPDKPADFLQANACIDFVIHGEGEQVFLKILESFPDIDLPNLPSASYRAPDGTVRTNPRVERLMSLDTIPSPYLAGAFDRLMAANPQETWLALWETNRGCPFSCTFCDWGSATLSKIYRFDLDRLFREIDWFTDQRIDFVFCCDANFGILPRDLDIAHYVAQSKTRTGFPKSLSVQNTKNRVDRAYDVQKVLAESGLNKGVTLSLQSVDPGTLRAIKRENISSEAYTELQRRFTRDGIETYSDVILALPGETYESFANGVSSVMDNGQHNRIQFNNLSILPNAEMGDPAYQKLHGMEMVTSKIINIHGSIHESDEEVQEWQELVIGTATMPRDQWIRTRVFSWATAFLHFDKVFQIPILALHDTTGLSYREIIEIFTESDLTSYPVLARVFDRFRDYAAEIQAGATEYLASEEWLGIFWPLDEYALIDLVHSGSLSAFYSEALSLIADYLVARGLRTPERLLEDAARLNEALIKLPFFQQDITLRLSYSIWEYYRALLETRSFELKQGSFLHTIRRSGHLWSSWAEWYREVIWYGNKKGAYLYSNPEVERELAGHF